MIEITLSQAIEGYFIDAQARDLSPRTLSGYRRSFGRFAAFLDGDPRLSEITPDTIRRFLSYLASEPMTQGGAVAPGRKVGLSQKTIFNIRVALSALWTWAIDEGFVQEHVVQAVDPPRYDRASIEPFTKAEVKAMLAACDRTESYTRPGKSECSNARPTANRDRAIILLLLDTGMRSGELACNRKYSTPGLRVRDFDPRARTVKVAREDQERIVPLSKRTAKAITAYLEEREYLTPDQTLFLNRLERPLTVSALHQLIKRFGERADVPNARPSRFRHTYAVAFLKSGGKTRELRRLMGNVSAEMIRRYVKVAKADLEEVEKQTSPVSNWRL